MSWNWRRQLDALGPDLFGVYVGYLLPSKKKVRTCFGKVLEQIRDITCDRCGHIRDGVSQRVRKGRFTVCCRPTVVSGFLKPVNITSALLAFSYEAGRPLDPPVTRVRVTKLICDYIKERHLYDDADKRLLLPDARLGALLGYDPHNIPLDAAGLPAPLTYFRLQRYLKRHFIPMDEKRPDPPCPLVRREARKPKKRMIADPGSGSADDQGSDPDESSASDTDEKVDRSCVAVLAGDNVFIPPSTLSISDTLLLPPEISVADQWVLSGGVSSSYWTKIGSGRWAWVEDATWRKAASGRWILAHG